VVFNIISAAGTVLALAFSLFALYRQRAMPRVEAHPVTLLPGRFVEMRILNTGTASARAPWFMLVADGQFVIGHAGAFLAPGKERKVRTEMQAKGRVDANSSGVVGCYDSKGRLVFWRMAGGRRRRRRTGTFQDAFEALYGSVMIGEQKGVFGAED
jgi:hypothetical protein